MTKVTAKPKSILLVVEGESDEVKLSKMLFESIVHEQNRVIYPFATNIYALIEMIVNKYDGDYESLEICRVLAEMLSENDQKRQILLGTKFTDVILMFDFDPQDNRFNLAELKKMVEAFDDSTDTDKGLLVLNYPAVEAVKVAAALPYDTFVHERYSRELDGSFKKYASNIVGKSGGNALFDFDRYDAKILVKAIGHTAGKIQYLVEEVPIQNTFPMQRSGRQNLSDICLGIRQAKVLDYESRMYMDSNEVATLGTGLLFVAAWARELNGTWKSYFGE